MSQRLYTQINAIVDACSPACRVRNEFMLAWRVNGITHAYRTWRDRTDLLNLQYIPQLEALIEQAKQEGMELLR